ncbi:amino acid permease [Streptomyces sp. NBC_00566]|uniref:amino acid permease n=1 Tax=Streptomyces sp. NBC_00566 TaxID=2975778 RepID=UPI002E805FB0|nr:amino acid permease [Streptomyces sp. NBC_00566]WUB88748.1 amino acid permease [Streptomyces sp. NBC_00566]
MPSTTTQAPQEQKQGVPLSSGLKQRHLSMIALGGVIGAGLFVGSGAGIAAAGPSIVVAYALSGLLVLLVMRMLGELSSAYPSSGSFSAHAERAIGPWAGFTVGWSFWVMQCTVVGLEGIGAGKIVSGWLPGTPQWAWVALFMLIFCGANLTAVKNFGEFEFWFAALKVVAICAFLLLGVLAIAGVLPGTHSPGASHLTDFLPNGSQGLVLGLLASVFAYGGLETVTIAAAESEDPVKGVASAVRTTMWRIALFYIGSMAVVVTLVPWDSKEVVERGPYVAALDSLGIPGAGRVMDVVVLAALLSAMNANIYGSSRMLHSLVQRGLGPKALAKVSGGVPRIAVLVSSVFGFGCVLLSYWRPDDVFMWLLNMIGAVILVVWIFVGVSQLLLRRRAERAGDAAPAVRMWAFPWLTWVALLGMVVILVLMAEQPGTRVQLYSTGGLTLALAAAGYVWQRARARG